MASFEDMSKQLTQKVHQTTAGWALEVDKTNIFYHPIVCMAHKQIIKNCCSQLHTTTSRIYFRFITLEITAIINKL